MRESFGFLAPSAHGMPDRYDYDTVFATVRDPASWLASAWGSRMTDGWRPYPERSPWTTFCNLVDPYKSNDFEKWCCDVLDNVPGVVGWLYGAYIPPPVKPIRLGQELSDFITDLGGDADLPPENVNTKHGVVFGREDWLRKEIYEVEYSTYVKYGFEEDGSYV